MVPVPVPTPVPTPQLETLKKIGIDWTKKLLQTKNSMTKPGSIIYLLHGRKISDHSINVRFGHLGEILLKNIIESNENLKLFNCGIQDISNLKLDVDLIWYNKDNNTLYVREIKANINLDTEKIKAVINKLKIVFYNHFKEEYPDYNIDVGLVSWTLYKKHKKTNRYIIRNFAKNDIKVEYFNDFLKLTNFVWSENDFYSYFKELGKLV